MCIILDSNILNEILGSNRTPAAEAVWQWINGINKKRIKVVIGGKLRCELDRYSAAKNWLILLSRRGNVLSFSDQDVGSKEKEVKSWELKSDDPHVIALALVSKARLLYSNDLNLHGDFKNTTFINNPKGKVFSTHRSASYDRDKRELLEKCRCRG